jgi:hypothetical protein
VGGEIDPTGIRKKSLDSFLEMKRQEGLEIETHTDTHAIVVDRGGWRGFLERFRGRGGHRYVVSVDEHGSVTMIPAERKRA